MEAFGELRPCCRCDDQRSFLGKLSSFERNLGRVLGKEVWEYAQRLDLRECVKKKVGRFAYTPVCLQHVPTNSVSTARLAVPARSKRKATICAVAVFIFLVVFVAAAVALVRLRLLLLPMMSLLIPSSLPCSRTPTTTRWDGTVADGASSTQACGRHVPIHVHAHAYARAPTNTSAHVCAHTCTVATSFGFVQDPSPPLVVKQGASIDCMIQRNPVMYRILAGRGVLGMIMQ